MKSVTVTNVFTERLQWSRIHGFTTVSFVEGKGLPNLLVAYHPSALLSTNWRSRLVLRRMSYYYQPVSIKDVCCIKNEASWLYIWMNQCVSRLQHVKQNADYNTWSYLKHMSDQNTAIGDPKYKFNTHAIFSQKLFVDVGDSNLWTFISQVDMLPTRPRWLPITNTH
jgi:hypothetical protein